MPLLAASAAGRLVAAILARANGPHAPAARPLHPRTLWEQLSRRLGYTPPGVAAASAFAPLPSAPPPRAEMVWRVRAVRAEPVEEPEVADEMPGWMFPTWPVSRPTQSLLPAQPTAAVPAPPLAQLPALPPTAAVQREVDGSPALPVIQRAVAAPSASPAAPASPAAIGGVLAPAPVGSSFAGPAEPAFRTPQSLVPAVSLGQQVAYQFGLAGTLAGRGLSAESTPVAPSIDTPDVLRLARPAPLTAEALPAPPASALAQEIAYRFGQDTPPGTPSSFAPPAPTVPSRWSGDLVWRVNPSRAAAPPPAEEEVDWIAPESPAPFRPLPTIPAASAPGSPLAVAEDRVQVAYTPGPAVPPPAPLVAPPALRLEVPDVPAPPRPPEAPAPLWHLGNPAIVADLVRPMIPTTDLLSRLERNIYVEPQPVAAPAPPASEAPLETPAVASVAAAPAEAVPTPVAETPLAASPAQPVAGVGPAVSTITAPPPAGPAPLAMPLTDTRRGSGTPGAADRMRSVEDMIAAAEAPAPPPATAPERGPWGRLVDRVVEALPAPMRRALEAATTSSRTEPLANPPATAPVTPPVPAVPAAQPTAQAASPAAGVAPAAPLEASAPAPLPALPSAIAPITESPQAAPARLTVPTAGESTAPVPSAMQGGSPAPAVAVESSSSAPATPAPALPPSAAASAVSSVPPAEALPSAPAGGPDVAAGPAPITPDATLPASAPTSVSAPTTLPVPAAPPARGVGGLFASVINRLLGNTPAPGASPVAPPGPAPLEMPWVRRAAPGASGPESGPADLYADVPAEDLAAPTWPAAMPGRPSVPGVPQGAAPVAETPAVPLGVTLAMPAATPAPAPSASATVSPAAPVGVPETAPAVPVSEVALTSAAPAAAPPAIVTSSSAAPIAAPGIASVAPAAAEVPAPATPGAGVPPAAAQAAEVPAAGPVPIAPQTAAASSVQNAGTPEQSAPGIAASPAPPPVVPLTEARAGRAPGAPEPGTPPAVPLVTPPMVPGAVAPPARGVGALFASVINRLLGNASAPGTPPVAPSGPAPLEMPWVRRPAPGASGPESSPVDLYADVEAEDATAPAWPATATQGQAPAPTAPPVASPAELPTVSSAGMALPAELPTGPAPIVASAGEVPITETGPSAAVLPPAAPSVQQPTAQPAAAASPVPDTLASALPVAQAPMVATPPPMVPPADMLSGAPGAPGASEAAPSTAPASLGASPEMATTSTSSVETPSVPVLGTPAAPLLGGRPTSGEPNILPEVAIAPQTLPATPPPVETGAPAMPIVPAAPLVSPAQARGLRGSGGLLGAILNRLLGGTAAPPAAPGSGPPPLAMPWAQRQRPADRTQEFGPEPEIEAPELPGGPLPALQRSVAAPAAPTVSAPPAPGSGAPASVFGPGPSGAASEVPAPAVGAPPSVAGAPVPVESGVVPPAPEAPAVSAGLTAVPAVPPVAPAAEIGGPTAGEGPAVLPTVPAVPPGTLGASPSVVVETAPNAEGGSAPSVPADADETEQVAWLALAEAAPLATAGEPWLDTGAMAASVARAHAPLVPAASLGMPASAGLWGRLWSALDRVFRAPAGAAERGPVPMDAPEAGTWPEPGGTPSFVRRLVGGYAGSASTPGSVPTGGAAPGGYVPASAAGMTSGYAPLGTPGLAQPPSLSAASPSISGYAPAAAGRPAFGSALPAGQPGRLASTFRMPSSAFVMAPAVRAYLRGQGGPEALDVPGAEGELPGDEWGVVPGTSLLSLEAMAPGLLARLGLEAESTEPAAEPAGGEFTGTHAQLVAALDRLYGAPPETGGRPLAVPYGSFVVPTEQNPFGDLAGLPPELLAGLAPGAGQEAARGLVPPALSAYLAPADSAGTPSTPRWTAPGAPVRPTPPASGAAWQGAPEYAPGGASPGNGASGAGPLPFGGPDGSGADEAAWAAVVAAALDYTGESRSPALALAGEEVAPPAPAQAPQAADAQGPDLDQLADTVYEIIRRRLRDESERTWT